MQRSWQNREVAWSRPLTLKHCLSAQVLLEVVVDASNVPGEYALTI